MYKLLLCWRYLLTRYLALACIVSVMLGVATLIVVNSVMAGFSAKLKDRLHGLLSDVLVEALTLDGFPDPDAKMELIRRDPYLRDRIEAMTPTMEIFAMLTFDYQGSRIMRPVHIVGIDPVGRTQVGGFSQYLERQRDSTRPTFALDREALRRYEEKNRFAPQVTLPPEQRRPGEPPPPEPTPVRVKVPAGVIVGRAIATYRMPVPDKPNEYKEIYTLEPGDDVILTTVSGQRLEPVYDRFTVCDYFKSEMSEYDSSYVFVPLQYLQHLRTMQDRATSIQIKLKDYRDARKVVAALQRHFPEAAYRVETWEDKQGPLLAAIAVEKGLLNVLLFLIIGVAGFGILAIFAMIVVEKTRDIGILKALGASNTGVMNIFLAYGLLLGVVGAALGTGLGLSLTVNINAIEKLLTALTGHEIFRRDVYYFDLIPTDIQPISVLIVNAGAVGIAVLFSVLPALRAALLHPVRALRYE